MGGKVTTERQIEQAFLRGSRSISDAVRISQLKDALSSGDYGAILNAVDIEPAAFDELRVLLVQVYAEGGISEITGMPYRDRPRWNSATSQGERFARDQVGGKITVITEDMRAAVRETVADGYALGRSHSRMALDIAGRMGPGGRRVGGIVGLNAQQAGYVNNMRRYLDVWPDWPSIRRMTLRDKRFDGMIKGAYEDGRPLTKDQIDRITQSYSNRLLRHRGEVIARTERGSADNAGRMEAWRQAADKLGLPYDRIVKTWVHSSRMMYPREAHLSLAGTEVAGLDGLFDVNGHMATRPYDPILPASEVVNCGCSLRMRLIR